MKLMKIGLSCLILGLLISGCGSSESKKWVSSEMAGLDNPGFTLISKSVSSSEVRYQFSNISDQKVSDFLSVLYASSFITNQNYIAESTYVSYAAFNTVGESLHFIFNPLDKTGVLIYGKASGSRFVPGPRDLGYSIQSNFEYASNSDSTKYNATLWYSVGLNVKLSDYLETVVSCKISNFTVKTASKVGSLSFGLDAWSSSPANFVKTCSGLSGLSFVVRQRNIGSYPTTMAFTQDKKPYFEAMALSQGDLNFTITFKVEVKTDKHTYTKNVELKILPSGFDTTKMNTQTYTVDQIINDFSLGIPYTKE